MSINAVAANAVLHVNDLQAALEYYVGALGASIKFTYEGRYAGVTLGNVEFHVSQGGGEFNKPVGGLNLYLFLETPVEVDAAYERIVQFGGKVYSPPADYPYGMRDFASFDLDGNVLTFGAPTGEE